MRIRYYLTVVVALSSSIANPVSADENTATKAILDKAVKALGGEETLAKYQAATWKFRMKSSVAGRVTESSGEEALQWPGCYRGELETRGLRRLLILNGEKGWTKDSSGIQDTDERGMKIHRRKLYSRWIPVVVLPLREKIFKLEHGNEEKVGERLTVSIKVTPPDNEAFGLYFDKESGLPIRIAMEPKVKGTTAEWGSEEIYSEYKEVQGLKKAMKIVWNDLTDDRKLAPVEFEISDFKFAEKLDRGLFNKPEGR
jgi:hypothetical protein